MSEPEKLLINGQKIDPGSRTRIDLPLPPLYSGSALTMPVHVIHGKKSGPRLFVSAAIHGDELNGIEIIRRLMLQPALKKLRGALLMIPMVNVYGVLDKSRYLPDRRDLNRCFPGSPEGSLAARLADLFMSEIVANCQYGIDLHTAAVHRSNLPQIRANLDDAHTLTLAQAFDAPLLLNSKLRGGSLRKSASKKGVPMLLYEAGEALRFDENCILAGVQGIIGVMHHLGMLGNNKQFTQPDQESCIAHSSTWLRAPASGIFRSSAALGEHIEHHAVVAIISDPSSNIETKVTAPVSGLIIGRSELPLVYEGDALFHMAQLEVQRQTTTDKRNILRA